MEPENFINSIFQNRADSLKKAAVSLIHERDNNTLDVLECDKSFQDMIKIGELIKALHSDWLISINTRVALLNYLELISDDIRDFEDAVSLPNKVKEQHIYAEVYFSKHSGNNKA
jgi:hypothetical protein